MVFYPFLCIVLLSKTKLELVAGFWRVLRSLLNYIYTFPKSEVGTCNGLNGSFLLCNGKNPLSYLGRKVAFSPVKLPEKKPVIIFGNFAEKSCVFSRQNTREKPLLFLIIQQRKVAFFPPKLPGKKIIIFGRKVAFPPAKQPERKPLLLLITSQRKLAYQKRQGVIGAKTSKML